MRARTRGFTLVEMVVALAIGAIAAGATAMSLSNVARTRDGARARAEAFDRAQRAADRMAMDVLAVVRDHDLYFTRVLVINGESAGLERDELLVMSSLGGPTGVARVQAEADFAEVQYRVMDAEVGGSSGSAAATGSTGVLWRRVDSTPDDVQEGGGIATPLTAGIVSVSIRVSDAQSGGAEIGGGGGWYEEWDSDYDGLPHLVRITVTAQDDNGRALRTYRRTVAIDRVPLVGASIQEEEAVEGEEEQSDTGTGGDASAPSSSGNTGTSGTSGGGGRTGGGAGGTGGGGGGRPSGGGAGGQGGGTGGSGSPRGGGGAR